MHWKYWRDKKYDYKGRIHQEKNQEVVEKTTKRKKVKQDQGSYE